MKKSIFLLTLVLIIGLSFAACSKTEPETITPDPNPDTEDTTSVPETPKSRAVEVLNLTPDFIAVSGIEKGGEYETGSEATLTLTPGTILSSGFEAVHMEHIHVHVGDIVYIPEFPSPDGEYIQSLSLKVQIPEDDFEVVACYSGQQQMTEGGYTMYLEDNEYVRLYGVSHEEQYKYFACYLLTVDAYTITNVQFKVGDGEWRDVSDVEGCSFSRSKVVENVYSVAIRPDYQNVTGDVTLRVEGEQHGRYTITWENADETYLDMEKSVLPSESIDGETVTAELWVHDEYYLNTAEASVPGLELNVISRAYVQFVMPASDVTVSVIYEDVNADEEVSVIAYYDSDIYDVSSSTNWNWDFTEGFTVAKGSTFYLSIYNYENTMYYVGVQVGDNVTIYPAEFDDIEYYFGKAIVADGDVIIKVGATEEEVSF